MYAVIRSGGKQYRVEEGQQVEVERVAAGDLTLTPILVVDGARVLATPAELSAVSVKAKVVGDAKGPKISGFKYKNKSNQRKRWGHRQHYSRIEITGISAGPEKARAAKESPAAADAATTKAAAPAEKGDG
jgi:large subunit ribosomal protein L21